MKNSLKIKEKNMKRKKKQKEKRNYQLPSNTIYKSFKLPLKGILKQQNLLPKLEEIVRRMNDLVTQAYQFIRLYYIWCFDNNREIVINNEFILYSIKVLGISNERKPSKNLILLNDLNWFYENHFKSIYNHQKIDLKNCSHFISNISVQIETMISNNVKERFEMHFKRFVNITFEPMRKLDGTSFSKSDLATFKRKILNWNFQDVSSDFYPWMEAFGKHIFNFQITKSIYYHLESNPLDFLKPMFTMSRYLESYDFKIYQSLPLRSSSIPSNLMIDTSSLISFFYEESMVPGINKSYLIAHINEQRFSVWSWFLNGNHKIFRSKRYMFFCQIQTDGISCSLIFKRKDVFNKSISETKRTSDNFKYIEDHTPEQLEYLKGFNLVGCDPGKRSLVYMIDPSGKTLQYTAPQRRFESKQKFNNKTTERLRSQFGIDKIEGQLSDVNSNTTDFNKFKYYIWKKHKVLLETQEFYNHSTFRKMKLRSFIEGKRSEDKFIESIGKTFGQNSIIMYGDWSESEQMKNFIPTKGIGLRRLIHKKFYTVSINEAYTSKRCCECGQDLRNYIADNNFHRTKIGDKIHRILVCDNCVKQNIKVGSNPSKHVSPEDKRVVFRTRDKNSAKNILLIGKDWIQYRQRRSVFTKDYRMLLSSS
jgi:hypothetical protein